MVAVSTTSSAAASAASGPCETETLVRRYEAARRAFGEIRPLPGEDEFDWMGRMSDAQVDYEVARVWLIADLAASGDYRTRERVYQARGGRLVVACLRQGVTVDRRFYAG